MNGDVCPALFYYELAAANGVQRLGVDMDDGTNRMARLSKMPRSAVRGRPVPACHQPAFS
jgi:hypothetical protein